VADMTVTLPKNGGGPKNVVVRIDALSKHLVVDRLWKRHGSNGDWGDPAYTGNTSGTDVDKSIGLPTAAGDEMVYHLEIQSIAPDRSGKDYEVRVTFMVDKEVIGTPNAEEGVTNDRGSAIVEKRVRFQ